MPQWLKVLLGSLALMVGASAPSLILYTFLYSRSPIAPLPPTNFAAATHEGESRRDQERGDYKGEETVWHRATHDPVAIATLLLAIATAVLAIATWRAADDTRRALFLAQRPKIRIRNVVVHPPNIPGHYPTIFVHNHLVSGQFYAVNVGGTRATITEAHGGVYWTNAGIVTLPMERPYEGQDPNMPNLRIVLAPGQSTPLTFQSEMMLGVHESADIISGVRVIYVLGYIAYRDELGIARRTAFCRRYDTARGRFFAVDDPDYEHEE